MTRVSSLESCGVARHPFKQVERKEWRTILRRALEDLPCRRREVFVLRDIEELSTQETAEILGVSASAVKARLHRARLQLRAKLSPVLSFSRHGQGTDRLCAYRTADMNGKEQSATRRWVRRIEYALLACGLILLAFWGAARLQSILSSRAALRRFGAHDTATSPASADSIGGRRKASRLLELISAVG